MNAPRLDVLVDVSPGEVPAAWLDEDALLQRFEMERISMPSLVGGICLGRVTAVEKNMDAAFLDIGVSDGALLRRAKGVTEGQRLCVQVPHDAGTLKGPTVTRHPAMVGRTLSFRADQHGIQWSRNLGKGRARAGLEKALAGILPRKGGFTVRSAAAEDGADAVAAEMERLTARSAEIEALAGGGNLVFDRTEAMTVIDVNLGDAAHRPPRDDAALSLNQAPAAVIGRHIRVRNLSGLIAVDFISMRNKAHRNCLVADMRRRLAGDRVASDVLGITAGGVMEITRQRAGRTLAEFYEAPPAPTPRPHPHAAACHGLRHALRLTGAGRPVMRADPAILAALEGPLTPALDEPGRMEPDLTMER